MWSDSVASRIFYFSLLRSCLFIRWLRITSLKAAKKHPKVTAQTAWSKNSRRILRNQRETWMKRTWLINRTRKRKTVNEFASSKRFPIYVLYFFICLNVSLKKFPEDKVNENIRPSQDLKKSLKVKLKANSETLDPR